MLSACGALPAAAPTSLELLATSGPSEIDYTLVKLDAQVVAKLNQFHSTFGPTFRTRGHYAATNALGPGDAVGITVYETGGQSLFPPPSVVAGQAAGGQVGTVATGASNIPPQVVEADGTIYIPFVGRVKVGGLTPGQAGALIESDLQGKAVGPQVMVSLVNNIGNAATVGGEVNAAKPVPLSSRGERLLDVIAAAGGAKYPAYETYVQVMRRGEVGNVLLQTVVNNPGENIIVQPKDQIYLSHNPRTFAVLGATRNVASFPFAHEKVTLTEAIAQGGGVVDTVGDPSGIYLFRFEPWSVAKVMLDETAVEKYGVNPPPFVPILYAIDMRDARGYFLSQAIDMRDKDVVLITNAEATQVQKLLALVRGFTGIAYDLTRPVR